jgi:ATP-dependent Clp protease ATP-binding subunit ClpA
MFERFTDRARKIMALANRQAIQFHHEYIGTEHILLGLVEEGCGVGANALKGLGIDLLSVRRAVEKLIKAGPEMVTMGKLPQTPRVKKVIELAIIEARNLNHNYLGSEHLLLGLIREPNGVGGTVLRNMGLELMQVRNEIRLLVYQPNIDPIVDRTPELQRAWQYSIGEANKMGNQAVCTGHLLLSLLVEDKSIAFRLLNKVGLTAEMVREEIAKSSAREAAN